MGSCETACALSFDSTHRLMWLLAHAPHARREAGRPQLPLRRRALGGPLARLAEELLQAAERVCDGESPKYDRRLFGSAVV